MVMFFVFVNLINLCVVFVAVTDVVFVAVVLFLLISQHASIVDDIHIEAFLTRNSCPHSCSSLECPTIRASAGHTLTWGLTPC